MKVVHILPTDIFECLGGAERYVIELARAMSHKVDTTLIGFGKEPLRKREGNLTILRFKPLFYVKGLELNPFSLEFLKALKDADVIHCHQFRTVVTDFTLLYAFFNKKRVFVTDLGGNANFALSNYLPLWKKIERFLLVSKYHCEKYGKVIPKPSSIIYCGVDTDVFNLAPTKRTGRLLFCGRLLNFKGLELLIDVLEDHMELDIAGQVADPAYLDHLKSISQGKKVRFIIEISDEELIQLYREARVTVLPSLRESGMTTSMESMACGTPVISTAIDSLPEIIVEGETGFLIPINDKEALRQSVRKFYDHPELTEEMGQKGRKDMLKRFTWDAIADLCLKGYGEGAS